MTQLVPIEQARSLAPAKMQQRIAEGRALNTNFAEGVRDAFPRLSIRGKVFRIRAEQKEEAYVDPTSKLPLPFLDVVLVNGSRTLAKSYYKEGFDETDMSQQPDCWSLDSVRPDPSVVNKVHATCQDCPMNAFGSKITDAGKAAKACSDARRIVVTLPHYLTDKDPRLLMLRVPQSSLKNLKAYVELLAKNGFEPTGCVSRLSFDYQNAFPKLNFNFVGPVTDQEFDVITDLAASALTASMLNAPDFDNAKSQSTPNAQEPVQPMVRQAPPVTETNFGAAETEPAHGKVEAQPTQRQAPPAQQNVQNVQPADDEGTEQLEIRTSTEGLIKLPNDQGWLDPQTGELVIVQEPKVEQPEEQEVDPDVIAMKDGRFFNKKTGAFVPSQFKDAPAPAAGKPAKATATKPAKGRSTKADKQAALNQQTTAGNGAEHAQPQVVAASPKLEQLLGELVPPKK